MYHAKFIVAINKTDNRCRPSARHTGLSDLPCIFSIALSQGDKDGF
ncbi:hypothetical protein PATSB16_17960 [Pandoraea thiooxydans]|nr:hypothetical protein PATSB16_17960 [Pandoraea thiooxydans]